MISSPPAAQGTFRVEDTQSVDLALSGTGSQQDPYVLRATVTAIPGLLGAPLLTYADLAALASP